MSKRNTIIEDEAEDLADDLEEARELEKLLDETRAARREEIVNEDKASEESGAEQRQSATELQEAGTQQVEEKAETKPEESQEATEQSDEQADSDAPLTENERLDLLEKQFGLVQAELEDERATTQTLKKKLDQRAGEIGHLRQQITGDRSTAPQSRDLLAESAEELGSQPATREPASRTGMSATDMYAFKAARTDLLNGFVNNHPDVVVKDESGQEAYDPKFQELVQEFEKDYESELKSGDFEKYQEAVQDILNASYRRFSIAQKRDEIENARNRRTAVAEQNQKTGLAAAISNSSGSGATATSQTREKSLEDMSIEELEALANSDPNRTHIPKNF
jgi:hypothetical protein